MSFPAERGLYVNQGDDQAGGGTRSNYKEADWQKPEWKSPLREEFFKKPEKSELGVTYEPYVQLETIGFSSDRVREARQNRHLEGMVVVVIGVKPLGIGEASLLEAAAQGAKVAGVARSSADSVSSTMEKATALSGEDALWISTDITKHGASQKIIDATLEKFGRIDGLVLAAAQNDDKAFTETSRQQLRKLFEVNYWGQLFIMQDVLKVMEAQKKGRIAVVSSVGGARTATQPGYGPAKAGLENIVRSIPMEYVRLRGDIDSGAVASGLAPGTSLTGDLLESQQDRINGTTTAERSMIPAEVSEATIYLLNPNVRPNGKIYPIVGRGEKPVTDGRGLIAR